MSPIPLVISAVPVQRVTCLNVEMDNGHVIYWMTVLVKKMWLLTAVSYRNIIILNVSNNLKINNLLRYIIMVKVL